MGPYSRFANKVSPLVSPLYAAAAVNVTKPKRKLNSAACPRESPTKYPPTIVIIERLVPGHIATHCNRPTTKQFRIFSSFKFFPLPRSAPSNFRFRFSAQCINPAPKINEIATGIDPKRYDSIQESKKGPNAAAGANAAKMLMPSFFPFGSKPKKPSRIVDILRA